MCAIPLTGFGVPCTRLGMNSQCQWEVVDNRNYQFCYNPTYSSGCGSYLPNVTCTWVFVVSVVLSVVLTIHNDFKEGSMFVPCL